MDEPRIRAAIAADIPVIARTVDHAYRHYIARMGRPPAPMLDDHPAGVLEGAASVRGGFRVSSSKLTTKSGRTGLNPKRSDMFDFDVITGPGPLAALAVKEAAKDVSKKPTTTDQAGQSGTAKEVRDAENGQPV